ncbi:hypothetical protein K1W54_13025 [Micromonospora sp. CPCC 205371]|nr:hypothetical protein [Micromonospora sp. CPCC 205371]
MTRIEMIRLRRQMQRRIQEVVAERRMAVNQRPAADGEQSSDRKETPAS